MFQTKKDLLKRISYLESVVKDYENANDLKKEAGLSSCNWVICQGCDHAIFVEGCFGVMNLAGCDLTASCKDYKRRTTKE